MKMNLTIDDLNSNFIARFYYSELFLILDNVIK